MFFQNENENNNKNNTKKKSYVDKTIGNWLGIKDFHINPKKLIPLEEFLKTQQQSFDELFENTNDEFKDPRFETPQPTKFSEKSKKDDEDEISDNVIDPSLFLNTPKISNLFSPTVPIERSPLSPLNNNNSKTPPSTPKQPFGSPNFYSAQKWPKTPGIGSGNNEDMEDGVNRILNFDQI